MYHDVSLELTGEVGRRYPISLTISGVTFSIELTNRDLKALAALVLARAECPEAGRTQLPKLNGSSNKTTAIYLLRRTINHAIDDERLRVPLIANHSRGEYSLLIPKEGLSVGPPFRHLAPHHLDTDTVSRILMNVPTRELVIVSP